ncbi:MAG: hypothetical protein GY796_21710, partial [Chloroflexi bacterium]|nr:hypothetical protein [Chloroflexota bacterium]
MEKWIRIGDDEIAQFGNHSWQFSFPDGTYTITASQSEQDKISVGYYGKTEDWPIQRKEQSGTLFKISGLADWTPEILES